MEKTKQLYDIISDLWKFAHKYSDEIEKGSRLDWDSVIEELSKVGEDSNKYNASLSDLRNKLFVNVVNYFRKRELEIKLDKGDGNDE